MGFSPIINAGDFRCLWSLDSAWGNVKLTDKTASLEIAAGTLKLNTLTLPTVSGVSEAFCDGKPVKFTRNGNELVFDGGLAITKNLIIK